MFLFKAFSYGAITEEEHVQSVELVENFVIKLDQAASSNQHIAFRYSRLLRNLLRQGVSNAESHDRMVNHDSHAQVNSAMEVNPSPYISTGSCEVSAGQEVAPFGMGSSDLFQVSPEDTSHTATSFGNQVLWPFQTGTTGAFNDFPFPVIGGDGPSNLDFLTF